MQVTLNLLGIKNDLTSGNRLDVAQGQKVKWTFFCDDFEN